MSDIACPCLSNKLYTDCCKPFHTGQRVANSAKQLMCSRYSAFYLGNTSYLIATLHPDKRQSDDERVLKETIEQTQWLGLKIIKHQSHGETATVEFVAFYQDNDIGQLHECSNFIKQSGVWFYIDGDILPSIKISRNETCFCGSGKKSKKCPH